MLDQPVPNPLAKNPNVHTHKVFAAIGLILIGTIIAVAGIWWYAMRNSTPAEDNSTTTVVKTSTSSAKTATISATKDGFKTIQSNLGFIVTYPENWTTKSCEGSALFLSPTKDTLGHCDSDSLGVVSIIYYDDRDYQKDVSDLQTIDMSNFNNPVKTATTVGGKDAFKISGLFKKDIPGMGGKDAVWVLYTVNLSGKALSVRYYQSPTSSDVSKEFEQIVSSIKIN